MPRKSAALLAVSPFIKRRVRHPIAAPATLTPAEAAIWTETTRSVPADWFSGAQAQTLTRYCAHCVRVAAIEKRIAELDIADESYARLVKLAGAETTRILALARAMRLTQQSRLKAETAHNQAAAHTERGNINALLADEPLLARPM